MKQSIFVEAYKALEQLADNTNLTKMDQWKLYKLRMELKPHIEFQLEQENIVRNKFIEFADEEGNLRGTKMKEYVAEISSIGELDVEYEQAPKIEIKMVDGMTFKVMDPLAEFIEFLPPDE